MGRPKGALNHGFRYRISQGAKELCMAVKRQEINAGDLSAVAQKYQRLLSKAMRRACPDDATTLQRLGTGLMVLTRTVNVIHKLEEMPSERGTELLFPLD